MGPPCPKPWCPRSRPSVRGRSLPPHGRYASGPARVGEGSQDRCRHRHRGGRGVIVAPRSAALVEPRGDDRDAATALALAEDRAGPALDLFDGRPALLDRAVERAGGRLAADAGQGRGASARGRARPRRFPRRRAGRRGPRRNERGIRALEAHAPRRDQPGRRIGVPSMRAAQARQRSAGRSSQKQVAPSASGRSSSTTSSSSSPRRLEGRPRGGGLRRATSPPRWAAPGDPRPWPD